jgi:DegV family protein with EDD domain
MRKVKIIVDSCADLNSEQLSKYSIDYVRMFTVCDGKETPAELTWSAEEAHALYELMRSGKRITTAQVPVEEFNRVFKKYLDEGMDIIYIACSSGQSGSVNTGFVTAKKLMEEYEGSYIVSFDSLNASIGIGMLAMDAAKMAEAGASAKEIEEKLLSARKTVNEFVTVHSLDALKRAGRVSASSAFFGNLFGVKPILVADASGAQAAYKKVKGRVPSIKECIALLKENAIDVENQTVYLCHYDCSAEEIEEVKALIRESIPCKDIYVGLIGPIVGASVGPECIGVWAFGKEVTFVNEAK